MAQNYYVGSVIVRSAACFASTTTTVLEKRPKA